MTPVAPAGASLARSKQQHQHRRRPREPTSSSPMLLVSSLLRSRATAASSRLGSARGLSQGVGRSFSSHPPWSSPVRGRRSMCSSAFRTRNDRIRSKMVPAHSRPRPKKPSKQTSASASASNPQQQHHPQQHSYQQVPQWQAQREQQERQRSWQQWQQRQQQPEQRQQQRPSPPPPPPPPPPQRQTAAAAPSPSPSPAPPTTLADFRRAAARFRACLSFEQRGRLRRGVGEDSDGDASTLPPPSSPSSPFALYLSTASPRLSACARGAVASVEEAAEAAAEAQEREGRRWSGGEPSSSSPSSGFAPELESALEEARGAVSDLERAAQAAVAAYVDDAPLSPPTAARPRRRELLSELSLALSEAERAVSRAAASRFVPIAYDLETTGLRIVDKEAEGDGVEGGSRVVVARRDTITDIAAINLRSPGSRFSTLCNIGPDRTLPQYVAELTGLTDGDLRDPSLPSVPEAVAAFASFVERQCGRGQSPLLVAHKGRSFDDPFVAEEMRLLGELRGEWEGGDEGGLLSPPASPPPPSLSPPEHWHGLDTLLLSKAVARLAGSSLPSAGSRSLAALRDHYGLADSPGSLLPGGGDAEADALRLHRALPDAAVLAEVAKRLALDFHRARSPAPASPPGEDPVSLLAEVAAWDVGAGEFSSSDFGRNGAGEHGRVFGSDGRRGGSGGEVAGSGSGGGAGGSAAVESATLSSSRVEQPPVPLPTRPPTPPPTPPSEPPALRREQETAASAAEAATGAAESAATEEKKQPKKKRSPTLAQVSAATEKAAAASSPTSPPPALGDAPPPPPSSFMTPSLPEDAVPSLRRAAAAAAASRASTATSTSKPSSSFLSASEVPLSAVPGISPYWRRVLAAHSLSTVADVVGVPPKSYDDANAANGDSAMAFSESSDGTLSVSFEPGARLRLPGVVVGARTPPMNFAARRKVVPFTVDVDVGAAVAERWRRTRGREGGDVDAGDSHRPRVILRVTRFAAGRAAFAIASKNVAATPVGSRVVVDGAVKQQQASSRENPYQNTSRPPPPTELDSSSEVLAAQDPRVVGRGDVSPLYQSRSNPSIKPERYDEIVCHALDVVRDPTAAAMLMATESKKAAAALSPPLPPLPPFGAAVVGGALPDEVSAALGMSPWSVAAVEMHAPSSAASAEGARRRLAVEELAVMELVMEKMRRFGSSDASAPASSSSLEEEEVEREAVEEEERASIFDDDAGASSPPSSSSFAVPCRVAAEAAASALPFELTEGQRTALREILEDMEGGAPPSGGGEEKDADDVAPPADDATPPPRRPMSRLLQGDVGSGKSAVALVSLLSAVGGGSQGALMAPTEVLAAQLHAGLERLISALAIEGEEPKGDKGKKKKKPEPAFFPKKKRPTVALLTGSTKAAERREILRGAASGEIDVVVGTHALSSDAVSFRKLGLAVVDEQHRFGVLQRSALLAKADPPPHVLSMSATPIPRSLALVASGEAACSVVDGRPPGRGKVETFVVFDREDGREAVAERLRRDLGAGGRVFIVCPRVAESNPSSSNSSSSSDEEAAAAAAAAPSVPELRAAEEEHARLLESGALGQDVRVGLLHGRLRPAEKAAALEAFRVGETQVLISTSVVEVGVDVPEATSMVVEGADSFGLAQLHQLRGRVGRGGRDGTCVLMVRTERGAARLRPLAETDDGFRIAEADLRERGPGDFLGAKQSGWGVASKGLRAARLPDDIDLLARAREAAMAIVEAMPFNAASPHSADDQQQGDEPNPLSSWPRSLARAVEELEARVVLSAASEAGLLGSGVVKKKRSGGKKSKGESDVDASSPSASEDDDGEQQSQARKATTTTAKKATASTPRRGRPPKAAASSSS